MLILVSFVIMGDLRAWLEDGEKVFPFLLTLQSFLGSLQLLDALGVVYYLWFIGLLGLRRIGWRCRS